MEPNPNVIYQWIRCFSQGDIIALFLMGVAMFFYHRFVTKKLFNGISKIPPPADILTKGEHELRCKVTLSEIKALLIENRAIAKEEVTSLKALLLETMRADILEALRNNRKKE